MIYLHSFTELEAHLKCAEPVIATVTKKHGKAKITEKKRKRPQKEPEKQKVVNTLSTYFSKK